MTEKEKMLNGELYMPENDETLFNERIKCKTLCHKYNNLSPDKIDERKIDTTPATKEDYDKLREASDEFFKMFAKYFYGFWD